MDGGAEGSGAGWGGRGGGGGGRGVMNSWPIPSRMPSNLCYKEGHPSSGQAAALYTAARTRKHAARMPDSHSHKRAQWSQPGAPVHHPENSITPSSVEGCSATPLLGAGKGAVVHCCSSIWEVFLFFNSGQGFCTYRSVVFLVFALCFSMHRCHLIDFLSDQVVKLHPGCLLTTKIVFKYHRHESFSPFPQKVRRQNIPSSDWQKGISTPIHECLTGHHI